MIASRPSQSPKLDSDMDSQSWRKSRTRRTARSLATRPTAPIAPSWRGRRPRPHDGTPGVRPAAPRLGGGAGGRQAVRRAWSPRPTASSGSGAGGVGSDGMRAPGVGGRAWLSLGGVTVPGGEMTISADFRLRGIRDGSARCRRRAWGLARVGCGGGRRAVDGRRRPSRVPRDGVAAAWDPTAYRRFGTERGRPFTELVSRIGAEAPAIVVDLGCGEGSGTATLARRWPGARVIGVDSSPEMLSAAAPGRVEFVIGDVRDWTPDGPVDVVVTNAVLHWIPGHDRLIAEWASRLRPGGWLALQVPGNFRAPTHALLADLCRAPAWADRLADVGPRADAVLEPAGYLDVLTGAGLAADVWETTYLHVLTGADPVLGWVRSTVLRPVLARQDGRRRRVHRGVRRRAPGCLPGAAGRDDAAALPTHLRGGPPPGNGRAAQRGVSRYARVTYGSSSRSRPRVPGCPASSSRMPARNSSRRASSMTAT